jgi:hypothetical protein
MGLPLSYFLPRQHTSLRRSVAICSLAILLSLPIDVAAYQLLQVGGSEALQWLTLLLLTAAWLVRFVPAISAAFAFLARRGWINPSDLALQAMLVRDYVAGLLPRRRSGD